jgi:hypothetical protein
MEPNVEMQTAVQKPSLFGMILSPREQFERLMENPKVWGAMIILLVVQTLLALGTFFFMMKNPELLQLQANLPADADLPKGATLGIGAFSVVAGLIGGLIMYFVVAALYKIIMMFMGNDTPYSQVLGIVVYASVISLLGSLVNGILTIAMKDPLAHFTSLAPLFEKGTVLSGIASAFDIFVIWHLAVLAIGLRTTAKLSKVQTAIIIILSFLVTAGFSSLTGLAAGL